MPRFHTKTIESILDPVAQQVSQLVILHEEAEDGNAMPDLAGPVQTVSAAVTNLSQVGKETIYISKDEILKEDMPPTLTRVEDACLLLVEASRLLKSDPFSAQARKKLIEGSRGILQGTSGLLLCFDESEVRKIVRCCKNVLEYLAVTEVVESMEDLVTFVKKLTPGLTDMTKQVDAREKELTHQVHREMLQRSIATVKQLIPVLISAIKIFVSTNSQGMPGLKEAQENRDYTVRVMSDEIQEIIRVLQLTTYDEDEWDADDIMVMKKARNAIEGRMKQAKDWLQDPRGVVGGVGERSLRQILEDAMKVAERCNNPAEAEAIKKQVGDIQSMVDSLAELRSQGLGDSPAAVALARGIQQKMDDLQDRVDHAVAQTEKAGLIKAAHTMDGRVEQAQRWLANPGADKGLGEQATRAVIAEGRKVANTLQGPERNEVLRLCDDVEQLTNELADLCRRGMGNTPQAKAIARNLSGKLQELKNKIQGAVMKKVADDFMDITTPLKELSKAALAPPDTPNRNPNFQEKARAFEDHGYRLVDTSKMLAATGDCCNKKVVEGIINASDQLNSQIPQIVNAASIVLSNPGNKGAEDHFELMKKEYVDNVEKLKNMVDVATDSAAFIKANEDAILYETERVEHAIKGRNPAAIVQNTSSIARRAQRVVQVAKMEAENSEDPLFVQNVESSLKNLESTVTPMVIAARNVSMNPADGAAAQQWRSANDQLINGVRNVRKAVTPKEELPPPPPLFEEDFPAPPDLSGLNLQDVLDSLCNASPPCNFPDSVRIPVSPKSARRPVSPHSSPMTQRHSRLSPTSTQQHPTTQLQVHLQPAAHPPPAPVQPPVPAPPVPPPPGDYFRDVPPRPPLPQESAPPRPPPPEEQEAAVLFKQQPKENQPIMVAAHALHQEVKQWESNDNELIAAAKKMALLMAKLSQLVRGEGGAKSKKELIATAKAIAAASEEVTRLANDLARQCTDKRMRTNLWQVCERIPTIGTQLKILSTVKATMLGAQGSDEDQEATEMLVGNAQNLMQSVRETVRAAEAASIKIRVDSGYTLKWVRMKPWYTS